MDAYGKKPNRPDAGSPQVPAGLGQTPANAGAIPAPPPRLTKREREVARLISLGCNVAEAASVLYRSDNTVDNHKSAAMKKLGTHNLAEFTRRIIQLGISGLDDQLSARELKRKREATEARKKSR